MHELITAETLIAWTRTSTPADDPTVAAVVAAVNDEISRLPVATDSDRGPGDAVKLAALMLGARLLRRRNSANGIETMTAEGTVAYVTRYDPDIARMLRLDAPAVG